MRPRIGTLIGLAVSFLLLSASALAQQHGTSSAPIVMPARAVHLVSTPAVLHAPVRVSASNPSANPASHAAVPGMHPAAPRISAHPVGPKTSAHNASGQRNTAHAAGHNPLPALPSAEEDNGVPGLGFDYPHYAATHPNAGRHHANEGTMFPFIGGGIYIPSFGYAEAGAPTEVAAAAPQAEAEEGTAEDSEPDVEERTTPVPSVKSRSRETIAPSRDYIFVRRDGTVFFAVAYSWSNGSLQYVTQDGFRKLVPIVTLDLDATTQFNEQRGVAFHSPA